MFAQRALTRGLSRRGPRRVWGAARRMALGRDLFWFPAASTQNFSPSRLLALPLPAASGDRRSHPFSFPP